jgi:hypothetical protein
METDLEHSIRLLQEIVEHMMESWFKGNYDSLEDLDYAIHEIINCSAGIAECLPEWYKCVCRENKSLKKELEKYEQIRNRINNDINEFENGESDGKTNN